MLELFDSYYTGAYSLSKWVDIDREPSFLRACLVACVTQLLMGAACILFYESISGKNLQISSWVSIAFTLSLLVLNAAYVYARQDQIQKGATENKKLREVVVILFFFLSVLAFVLSISSLYIARGT